jgi:hypothetical protein
MAKPVHQMTLDEINAEIAASQPRPAAPSMRAPPARCLAAALA